MYGLKWPFLLRYGSRDTRSIDFLRVDGLSTDTPVLGRHNMCFEIIPTAILTNPGAIFEFYLILRPKFHPNFECSPTVGFAI